MSGFISSSPFQNTKRFLQIQSLAPGIAQRSSGRFQLRRQLRRAITPNPCIVRNPRVPLRSSRRGLRRSAFGSSIGSPSLRQSTDFLSTSARVFFPGEKPPLLHLGFFRFFVFSSVQSLSHSPLAFPGGGAPPPSVSSPRRRPFPPPRRWRRWPTAALALPRPTPARTPPRQRWPRPSRPVRLRPPPAGPTSSSPAQPSPLPLLSLPWMGERR
jgi:hypothetical protein